ncbi:MAG: hypothetical protein V3V93_07170 [bacterium]
MVFLAVIGGLIGGLCIPYAAFLVIAESLGWIVRRHGATPMWRVRKGKPFPDGAESLP